MPSKHNNVLRPGPVPAFGKAIELLESMKLRPKVIADAFETEENNLRQRRRRAPLTTFSPISRIAPLLADHTLRDTIELANSKSSEKLQKGRSHKAILRSMRRSGEHALSHSYITYLIGEIHQDVGLIDKGYRDMRRNRMNASYALNALPLGAQAVNYLAIAKFSLALGNFDECSKSSRLAMDAATKAFDDSNGDKEFLGYYISAGAYAVIAALALLSIAEAQDVSKEVEVARKALQSHLSRSELKDTENSAPHINESLNQELRWGIGKILALRGYIQPEAYIAQSRLQVAQGHNTEAIGYIEKARQQLRDVGLYPSHQGWLYAIDSEQFRLEQKVREAIDLTAQAAKEFTRGHPVYWKVALAAVSTALSTGDKTAIRKAWPLLTDMQPLPRRTWLEAKTHYLLTITPKLKLDPSQRDVWFRWLHSSR